MRAKRPTCSPPIGQENDRSARSGTNDQKQPSTPAAFDPDTPPFSDPWIPPTGTKHADTEASPDLGKTQPIAPITTTDILEVFARFQEAIFARLDRRDETMLNAIRDITQTMLEHYEREALRRDEHAEILATLRTRTHDLANFIHGMELRLVKVETKD
jgi:hypothetical protein